MNPAAHIEFEMIEEHIDFSAIVKKKQHCFCLKMLAFFSVSRYNSKKRQLAMED